MTPAHRAALRWLANRGETGVFNKNGVLLAQGDLAPVMRATWNALRNGNWITIDGRRVTMTNDGRSWATANRDHPESQP